MTQAGDWCWLLGQRRFDLLYLSDDVRPRLDDRHQLGRGEFTQFLLRRTGELVLLTEEHDGIL